MSGAEPDALDAAALAAFRAADYPCRVMLAPPGLPPDAAMGLCWLPTPWAGATLQGIRNLLAAGSGVILMARDRAELVRMRETVELLISSAGEA